MKFHILLMASLFCLSKASHSEEVPALTKDAIVECAKAGVAECQYHLAVMVEQGKLVQQDLVAAKALYEMAYRNNYEKAGADILRLSKISATPAADETRRSTRNNSAAEVPSGMPGAESKDPGGEPLRFGRNASELLLGGAFIGQTETGFLSHVGEGSCSDKSVKERTLRVCQGMITSHGETLRALALLNDGQVVFLQGDVGSESHCRALISGFGNTLGKPTRPIRVGIFATLTGTLVKGWGEPDKWMAMVACDPPASGGRVVLLGGNFAAIAAQL